MNCHSAVANVSSKRPSASRFGGACVIVVLLAVPKVPVSRSFHPAVLCTVLTIHSDLQASRCKSIKSPAGSVSWLRICVVHAYVAVAALCLCLCLAPSFVCLRDVIDLTRLLFLFLLIA